MRSVKCVNDRQMHYNFKMCFYLLYLHQHVSARNPAIFMVIVLIQG
jgi:hypothetical protein